MQTAKWYLYSIWHISSISSQHDARAWAMLQQQTSHTKMCLQMPLMLVCSLLYLERPQAVPISDYTVKTLTLGHHVPNTHVLEVNDKNSAR